MPPDTIRTITAVELGQVAPPAGCAIAIFGQTVSPALEACALNWGKNGSAVTKVSFSLEAMLRPTYMSHEPPADVTRIAGWLVEAVPAVTIAGLALPPTQALRHPGCDELAMQFGPDRTLFGMLCRPLGSDNQVAVVIVNTGGDPHHGYGRVNVDIARRFAAAGIASLRMDFAGLGDSLAPNDGETHVFEADRRADISAAIDSLVGLGFRRFALHGLCAGAFHAIRAALADARIGTLLLANLPLFEWRAGDKVELLRYVQKNPLFFGATLCRAVTWRKLLSGNLNVGARLTQQGRWIAARMTAFRARLAGKIGFGPRHSFANSAAQALSGRTRTLLLMAPDDLGLSILASEFGAGRSPPGATLHIVPEIDHSITKATMRRRVTETMVTFIQADRRSFQGARIAEAPGSPTA